MKRIWNWVVEDADNALLDDSPSNFTWVADSGTAVCVYRRQIAVNVDYIPYYDSYQLTATVRLAFPV